VAYMKSLHESFQGKEDTDMSDCEAQTNN
jgi:hypothetical protein